MRRRCPALLMCAALACVSSGAAAQWDTDDGGLWGARRCQSRNLISAGLVLGAFGAPLLQSEEGAALGVGVMLGGVAVAATGTALRIRLGKNPGQMGEHDSWPQDRCQARAMTLRGGVYLISAIVTTVRVLRLDDDVATPRTRALVALISVVPPALMGIVFTALGLRRLRRLGERPPPEPTETVDFPLVMGHSFSF